MAWTQTNSNCHWSTDQRARTAWCCQGRCQRTEERTAVALFTLKKATGLQIGWRWTNTSCAIYNFSRNSSGSWWGVVWAKACESETFLLYSSFFSAAYRSKPCNYIINNPPCRTCRVSLPLTTSRPPAALGTSSASAALSPHCCIRKQVPVLGLEKLGLLVLFILVCVALLGALAVYLALVSSRHWELK